jgi:RNase P/RNase MRP subunit p30
VVGGGRDGSKSKPAAIFVDYLQALPIDPEIRQAMIKDQRRLQVRQDVYRLRQAAVQFDCPIILASQAKQNMTP